MSLLNFDIGMWESVGVLIGMSILTRVISFFVLWVLKSKLQ